MRQRKRNTSGNHTADTRKTFLVYLGGGRGSCLASLTAGSKSSAGASPSQSIFCRTYATLVCILTCFIVSAAYSPARAESDSARVDRLFMWASSGEVRFQAKVAPAKDSLGAMGEKAARWLAHRMDATDARERLTLADIFEKIGPAGSPSLIPYLDSTGIDMPRNAARCLGLMKDTSATLPLTRQLDHFYYGVRSEVATALGKIADHRGLGPLLKRLAREDDSEVRKSCVVSLGLIADPQAVDALINALSDPFYGARQTAVIALGQIKPPPVTPLIESTRTLSGVGLYGALVAIGGCVDSKTQKFLFSKLEDPSAMIRGYAFEGLSVHADKKSVKRVRKMREKETDPFVLAQIARLEQRFKP